MNGQQEISRLSREAKDLGEFLRRACQLRGKGLTTAGVEAGLSRNAFSSYVRGRRRPSAESAYKMARYFGVSQASIMKLAGLEVAELDAELLQGVDELVRDMVRALNAEELNEWLQYGDLLLLRRERRERAGASGEV
ncbi:MAG: helix-turn-helix transcriptional regulator [Anaerolineae bacterium]